MEDLQTGAVQIGAAAAGVVGAGAQRACYRQAAVHVQLQSILQGTNGTNEVEAGGKWYERRAKKKHVQKHVGEASLCLSVLAIRAQHEPLDGQS